MYKCHKPQLGSHHHAIMVVIMHYWTIISPSYEVMTPHLHSHNT